MLLALLMIIVVLGTTGGYLSLTVTASNRQTVTIEREMASRVLDGAVGLKIAQLQRSTANVLPISGVTPAGVRFAVTAIPVVNGLRPTFRIGGYAESGSASVRTLVVVEQEMSNIETGLRGALTAYAPVNLSGNISVDGRDFDSTATTLVSGGTYAVASGADVTLGGSAKIGGNGETLSSTETAQNRIEFASWGDGTDMDGDGLIELHEQRFPVTVDQAAHLDDGSLKAKAQAEGTYFTSATAWEAYLSSKSAGLPGGKVFYLDFLASGLNIDFPDPLTTEPSVFVNHWRDPSISDPYNPAGISQLGNIHGTFHGLMILDAVRHVNGDFHIVGGIISLASQTYGNVFGNGSAQIHYSRETLGDLPTIAQQGNPFHVVAAIREGPDLLVSPVSDCLTLVRSLAAVSQ